MKVNKNVWVGKNKPYNRNSLYFPDGVNSGGTTPTPPSGGSGESGSNVEYWDITAAPEGLYEIAQFATLLKYTRSGTMYINSIYSLSRSGITPIGIAIDTSLEHLNNATIKTVGEVFKEFGYPSFDTLGWVRLTKEQFYSLD